MADEKKPGEVVDPADAYKHGYWGYTPVEKDRAEYSVAVQGPIAEEAAQGGTAAKPAAKRTAAKSDDK